MPPVKNSFEKTWDGIGLPTRGNCDMTSARQRFLWMFTGFAVKGAPLPLPTEFFEAQSEHLCECLGLDMEVIDGVKRLMVTVDGVRMPGDPLPDEPTRKYLVGGSMLNRSQAAGQWVDATDPDPEVPDARTLFAQLPQHDQAQVADVVLESFGLQKPVKRVRVSALAKRLGITADQVIEVADACGAPDLQVRSMISSVLADRVIARVRG